MLMRNIGKKTHFVKLRPYILSTLKKKKHWAQVVILEESTDSNNVEQSVEQVS